MRSPDSAPEYKLVRLVTANDAAFDDKAFGTNFGGYLNGSFLVIPLDAVPTRDPTSIADLKAQIAAQSIGVGTSNITIAVRSWDPVLEAFVVQNPAVAAAAGGAGVAYEFPFVANGRIIMPAIGGVTASESVAVLASASERIGLE